MGNDGDQLLAEHVQRIARKAGRLDVAFVHGAGDGGAGNEVGAVFRKQHALADGIDRVPGAANALHAAGHGRRRLDLDDEVDSAHVDAEFKRRCGAESLDLAGLQLLLDHRALVGGQRAVVGAGDRLTGKVVERTGQALGHLAAVDEEDRRVTLANEFEQARMNCVPDGDATRRLRSRSGGDFLHGLEPRHILNWNFNAQL